jgi:hypothetical protein
MVWFAVIALGVVGLVLVFVRFPRHQSSAPPVPTGDTVAVAPEVAPANPPNRGAANFPNPPASLPPARVQTPKSLNDLRIGNFVVNPRRSAEDLIIISGDVENVSDNVHRGIRVEIDLLDAQGLKVSTLTDFMRELAQRATWHVLAHTTNARAVSARLTGIKEEP